jgi:hypothetical protein
MGVGPLSVGVNDSVFLFAGGRVPFVMRRDQSSGDYSIIGECYVHGVMDGEVSLLDSQGWREVCIR